MLRKIAEEIAWTVSFNLQTAKCRRPTISAAMEYQGPDTSLRVAYSWRPFRIMPWVKCAWRADQFSRRGLLKQRAY